MRIRFRDDSGMTLVELLVAVSIGAVVLLAATGVLITTFKTQDQTTNSLKASHDTQLVGTWLPIDVASAANSGWDQSTTTTNPCATANAGTSVMKLPYAYVSGTTDAQEVVNYRLEPDGTANDLVRYFCVPNGTPVRLVLARTVVSATPTLTCTNAPNCQDRLSVSLQLTLTSGASVTYSGDGRTGTTLGALATTTTTSPSTTTTTATTSTTTTTTTQPCVANGTPNGNPSSVTLGNGGKLNQAVDVTQLTNGSCSGLTIVYTPKNSQATVTMVQGPAGTWKATIPADNTPWSTGPHTVNVMAGSTTIGSFTLQVS